MPEVPAPLPFACAALSHLVRACLLFVSVQKEAVLVADEYDHFVTIVRKSWNTVKDRDELELSVDTWSRFTDEEQWQLLESFGLKEPAQQQVLAREINKLLGISECRVQDGGSASLCDPHPCSLLCPPLCALAPSTSAICLAGEGWGHPLRPRECAVCVTTSPIWRFCAGGCSAVATPGIAWSMPCPPVRSRRVWRACSLEGEGGTCGALHTWACIPPGVTCCGCPWRCVRVCIPGDLDLRAVASSRSR